MDVLHLIIPLTRDIQLFKLALFHLLDLQCILWHQMRNCCGPVILCLIYVVHRHVCSSYQRSNHVYIIN